MHLPRTAARATLGRSIKLLRSFPLEQRDPKTFYTGLAQDTFDMIAALAEDTGAAFEGRVLDVGGGPGYFTEVFEPEVMMVSVDPLERSTVRADGRHLPFRTGSFDVTYSSNVVEHLSNPWQMCEEMLRVTRPGGLVVISYTVWLGPFGGHETGLWPHYVSGEFAYRRYVEKHGHEPKNVFGTSLFAVSCAEGLRWAQSVDAPAWVLPRYHPRWAWWVMRVPVLREFLVSNLVIVLRKSTTP